MENKEYYYNDRVRISREEAHEINETSKLVVADEAKTKAQCTEALK